jgi:hypothetical protein
MFPTGPSLPKQGALGTLTLGLACVADPKQLNHGVGEGKTAIGRTLTGVLIGRSFMQAGLNKFFRFGSAWSGTDEQMVQLYPHSSYSNSI